MPLARATTSRRRLLTRGEKIGMPLSERPEARARQLANLRSAPPPENGNARARTHGAKATAKSLPVEGRSRAIYEELAREAPLRDGDGELPIHDRVAIEALALCLCRLESVATYLQMHGVLTEDGEVRPAAEHERRLRREAAEHCAALGMTPRARVALGIDLQRGAAAQTLAELLSDLPDEDGGDE